jgi:hypothetical protein
MNTIFKYGLVGGMAIAGWDIMNYFILYKTRIGRFSFIVELVGLCGFLYFGMKAYKSKQKNREITFVSSSLSGLCISLIMSITLSIFTYGYYSLGNNSYEKFYISETMKAMEKQGFKNRDEVIKNLKQSFTPTNQAKGALVITLLLGGVLSFIFGVMLRNKLPGPAEGLLKNT